MESQVSCKKGYHVEGNKCIKNSSLNFFPFKSKFFEKSERKYMLYSLLFIVFMTFIILNPTANRIISGFNPILQYLILGFGVFFVINSVIKTVSGNNGTWKISLGTVLFATFGDILAGEYHVSKDGLVTGAVFGQGTSDYFLGYLLTGFNHFIYPPYVLGILVYGVCSILLLAVASILYVNFFKKNC